MRAIATALAVLSVGTLLLLGTARHAAAQEGPESALLDGLRIYAVHVNRTPQQSWPGYGMYLGNGLVITAAHVPGNFADTNPRVVVAGKDMRADLVKQGSLEGVDLTLLSVDAGALPVRMRMRRLPLCDNSPYPGESVVVVTPESAARSHVLPPAVVPRDLRARFDTVIGDVATTGNSGSGVLDARRSCLLGIISRKITVARTNAGLGAPAQTQDIAKYFVPVKSIRAFIPPQASF
jgi:hypothetical protein